MKRFLSKIALWGSLVFIGLNLIAFSSLYFLGKSCLYKPQFLKNGVKEKNFDYVVLGSSTGLTTLDTKLIDSLSGYSGLNASMDDSSMSAHYLMLQHFYSLGRTADKVILTITPWDSSTPDPTLGNNDYRFITFARAPYVDAYYKEMEADLFKPLSLSKYFPLFAVSYYNTEVFYPSLMTIMKPEKRNRFDDKGNYTYPVNETSLEDREVVISDLTVKNPFFKRISKLCRDNNSKLVVYIAPLYKQKINVKDDLGLLINHSDLMPDAHGFYDNIHVNSLGRKEASAAFAKSMTTFFENEEK